MPIKVKGTREIEKRIGEKLRELEQKTSEAVMFAALYMEGEVKASIAGQRAEPASVDTGRFMSSVVAVKKDESSAMVETPVEYAPYLEFGTSRIRPRRHFQNSLDRNRERVVEIFRETLQK